MAPKASSEETVIRPQEGPQTAFLSSPADIVIYGGAAGGGKTYGELLDAVRHTGNPNFGAVIFRRTNEDIRNEGALWDNSKDLYSLLKAKPREQYLDWTFKSGATITFSGLQHENDKYNWQGSQICGLYFDELTHFTKTQFWYLVGRNRSVCGIRPYVRATLNPDPDSWVFKLLGPWVDEDHPNYGAKSGEIRWLLHEKDEYFWVAEGTPNAKSITFISATVYDNKILLETNPEYLANLHAQSEEDQERLLHGSWKRVSAKGALWQREWFSEPGFRLPLALGKVPRETGGHKLITNVPSQIVRIVVALDPSVKDEEPRAEAQREPDECGICVAGIDAEGRGYVLADLTAKMPTEKWTNVAVQMYDLFHASSIVAEGNQGGDLIKLAIKTISGNIPVEIVHASVGKRARAEPVALLYFQNRVSHCGVFAALENQMCRWDPRNPKAKSPNNIDALVWAFHGLGLCNVTGARVSQSIGERN